MCAEFDPEIVEFGKECADFGEFDGLAETTWAKVICRLNAIRCHRSYILSKNQFFQ